MRVILDFDEKLGRLNFQYEAPHLVVLGILELAKYAILKKGASEGGLSVADFVRKLP